jgi:manganese-dependent ADP-ribose/CDP-alcohol diphosphatase
MSSSSSSSSSTSSSSATLSASLLSPSFALVADTQYVDLPDGSNFDGTRIRRFRQSLDILGKACEQFRQSHRFGVILGDIIDMKCAPANITERCFADINDKTGKCGMPWHFLVGNHDLACFSRATILDAYIPNIPQKIDCSPSRLYYDFVDDGIPNMRFIVLDAFEVSWIGAATEAFRQEAINSIKRNPNMVYNDQENSWPASDWLLGLDDDEYMRRFVPCGGGVSNEQLSWLRNTLSMCKREGERCIIFSHMPCFMGCTYFKECCIFNSDEVLSVLHEFDVVVAFFAGHDHTGGYDVDDHGIHHVIPPAPIDCQLNDTAFAEVFVRNDHLEMKWFGSPPPGYTLRAPWPQKITFPKKYFSDLSISM